MYRLSDILMYFIGIIFLITINMEFLYAEEKIYLKEKNETGAGKFRQLDELLRTANTYRTASGAPGHEYWQQQVDYTIAVNLNDKQQSISAEATIRYYNNSPDTLRYLWIQLDQNRFKKNSDDKLTTTVPEKLKLEKKGISFKTYRSMVARSEWEGGFTINKVTDVNNKTLSYVINKTMLRVDLPKPLKSGDNYQFHINWFYQLKDQKALNARAGYEYFKDDGNYLYELAQWFPRMAAYYDVYGWQHKQFLGRGEFTLEFGDYDVSITVPADHVVAATGVLQNPQDVLTKLQRQRLKKARTADSPVIIVTQEEAEKKEKTQSDKMRTWHFKAHNVRDFAWASSRKFIWDAQGFKKGDTDMLAMSFYPKEGNPLWQQYSTKSIIHTVENYNKYSFDYPYPISISVNGPVGGMEYPMITFNGPRPKKDKKTGRLTYSRRTKYGLISVIIHEVGHNYYPMIINSDERQWTWMDEGLNSFVQFLAEQSWEEKYPSRRGHARDIVDFMTSSAQVPIMTNSESLLQFSNNAYAKVAIGLNILRESIMGRELFDFAFREYAMRWKFKRPTPADFFRTMEDASAVDLDWFWRGWFYSTDHVDISLDSIREYRQDSWDPEIEKAWERQQEEQDPVSITHSRNADIPLRIENDPELKDFYNKHDKFTVTNKDRNKYQKKLKKLEDWQKQLLAKGKKAYVLDFTNHGGLVMPLILEIEYMDNSKEEIHIAAEIWRRNSHQVSKMLFLDKELKSVAFDPRWELADANVENNYYPRRIEKSRFQLFKEKKHRNLMKDMSVKLKRPEDIDEDDDDDDDDDDKD